MEMDQFSEDQRALLHTIGGHYLAGTDEFNGLPFNEINNISVLRELVQDNWLTVEFGDRHPNPYIKAFHEEPIEVQLEKLGLGIPYWVYPSPKYLAEVIVRENYAGLPFTLELALGHPCLEYRIFEPSVLERYRNDPRYIVEVSGFSGRISITDEFDEKADARDAVILGSFGFAKTDEGDPAIAVFLRYLNPLTPEHQQIWHASRLRAAASINRNYRMQVEGNWVFQISIQDAILGELCEINKLCGLLKKPNLFRRTFEGRERPRLFGILLRPTRHEFEKMVQILDKVLSDNLNFDFFKPEVEREYTENFEKKLKGSLRMLTEWVDLKYKGPNGEKYGEDLFESLRKVREERSKPAHTITEDSFDPEYFLRYRDTLESTYDDLSNFRLMLSKHPLAQGYCAPQELERENIGHIW